MRNNAFYTKNGRFITLEMLNLTIEQITDYHSYLELYDSQNEYSDLQKTLLKNYDFRKKYLFEYLNNTSNENLINYIKTFLENYVEYEKIRKNSLLCIEEFKTCLKRIEEMESIDYETALYLYKRIKFYNQIKLFGDSNKINFGMVDFARNTVDTNCRVVNVLKGSKI